MERTGVVDLLHDDFNEGTDKKKVDERRRRRFGVQSDVHVQRKKGKENRAVLIN